MNTPAQPVKVAIAYDVEIVVAGLREMLRPHRDRVIFEGCYLDPAPEAVDVVLLDAARDHAAAERVLQRVNACGLPVLVFTWHTDADWVLRALRGGAAGCLPKSATALEIVEKVEAVHAQRPSPRPRTHHAHSYGYGTADSRWPGHANGLSKRESEVLNAICRGMPNAVIAERLFLTVNTVKTYVRTAYRKMGVSTRSQAVLWGISHGFPHW